MAPEEGVRVSESDVERRDARWFDASNSESDSESDEKEEYEESSDASNSESDEEDKDLLAGKLFCDTWSEEGKPGVMLRIRFSEERWFEVILRTRPRGGSSFGSEASSSDEISDEKEDEKLSDEKDEGLLAGKFLCGVLSKGGLPR